MIRVFIGYDSKEAVAYHVLAHSILRRASVPVAIAPVMLSQLREFTRGRGPMETTEFSISRFLVPWLCGYEGTSIFMDCDMLCLGDVRELVDAADDQPEAAVLVAKHDYVPKGMIKFLGQGQTSYPRKNWSSLMVMRNGRCRELTVDYVNQASGLDLHRFNWLDDNLGDLSLEWNWLVGEYAPNRSAKMFHYTLGGPWFEDTRDCDHSAEWFRERDHMLGAA